MPKKKQIKKSEKPKEEIRKLEEPKIEEENLEAEIMEEAEPFTNLTGFVSTTERPAVILKSEEVEEPAPLEENIENTPTAIQPTEPEGEEEIRYATDYMEREYISSSEEDLVKRDFTFISEMNGVVRTGFEGSRIVAEELKDAKNEMERDTEEYTLKTLRESREGEINLPFQRREEPTEKLRRKYRER